jgi:hypothetical protein
LQDQGIEGRIIIKYNLKIGIEDLDRIRLAADSVQRRGLAKTTLNLRVPQNVGNFLTVYETTIFSR